MDVVSLCALRASGFEWQPRALAHAMTVVCKATFELRPDACVLAAEQEPLRDADTSWDDDPRCSVLVPSDRAPYKPGVDVVLVGYAYAPRGEPVRSLVTRLLVGDIDKAIEVWCDRSLDVHTGQLVEGHRQSRMWLAWERAAGGPETNNPVGMRFDTAPDPDGLLPIPNLQPPGIPFHAGDEGFGPVGYGPLAPRWPTRSRCIRQHAMALVTGGWEARPLPQPFDHGFFNVAPLDQRLPTLRPDERIVLENLHPHHPRLVTRLPDLRPRAIADRATGEREEIALVADTLWIDTLRGLCTVVWRGQVGLRHPGEAGRVTFWLDGRPLMAGPESASQGRATAPESASQGRATAPESASRRGGAMPESASWKGMKAPESASGRGGASAGSLCVVDERAMATMVPRADAAFRPALPFEPRLSGGSPPAQVVEPRSSRRGERLAEAARAGTGTVAAPLGGPTPTPTPLPFAPSPWAPRAPCSGATREPCAAMPALFAGAGDWPRAPLGSTEIEGDTMRLDGFQGGQEVRGAGPPAWSPYGAPVETPLPLVAAPSVAMSLPVAPVAPVALPVMPLPSPGAPAVQSMEPAALPVQTAPWPESQAERAERRETDLCRVPAPRESRPASGPCQGSLAVQEGAAPLEGAQALGGVPGGLQGPHGPCLPAAGPCSGSSLEQCAALMARIALNRAEKARILEEGALTDAQWGAIEAHWGGVIREETRRGNPGPLGRFDAAYVAQIERERGPIRVQDYARLLIAAERGTTDAALEALGLPRGAALRIERVWMERLMRDPATRQGLEQAVASERCPLQQHRDDPAPRPFAADALSSMEPQRM
ncbi:DUF2169 domain-containing protein [Chondromyces crocatus]|uniref:DUF2169 domain-containing protein n=1 Tax=Chondromyces crocatus TaxID=52 RepID=A0A0K1EBI7_CHOCO|nr:DUF2169 domain-containing protein [Chondromyces crocatus]AKT38209.1 uncharacterized protein CMC5_023520 [Chondromyces crocatus]